MLLAACLGAADAARADMAGPSFSDPGGVGLLHMPTARMAPNGTVATGYSWTPLYRHRFVTVQALSGLEITLRQSVDAIATDSSERQAGGVDLKFRLIPEGPLWPQIAVGGRALFGSARLSGEYLAFSRRWYSLDFTLGLGWGRFAERGGFDNPARGLAGSFGRHRGGGGPQDWFRGEQVAPFAGLEWRTPIQGLALKLEYSSDSFAAERNDNPALPKPWPVNAGLAWRPLPWLETGAALEQGRMAMLRAVIALDAGKLGSQRAFAEPPKPLGSRPASAPPGAAERRIRADLKAAGLAVDAVRIDPPDATVWIDRPDAGPAAQIVGRAARIVAARAPAAVERVTVVLRTHELDGTGVSLMRSELERAARHASSPAEIRRTAELRPSLAVGDRPVLVPDRLYVRLSPRLEQSLAGTGGVHHAYRGSLDAALIHAQHNGIVTGAGLRFNLADNLDRNAAQAEPWLPLVRSDLPHYARATPITVEHLYLAWLSSFAPGWHTRLSVGEFEEMFGGLGAELLLRPPGKRWATGADINSVTKRLPGSLIYRQPGVYTSGHFSLYYENPDALVQGVLRAGRYLAGDQGLTLELSRTFESGVRLGAYVTRTDAMPGGALEHGISLRIPLGGLSSPTRSVAPEIVTRSPARDAGQRLVQPLPLYDLTSAASHGRITGSWDRLMD